MPDYDCSWVLSPLPALYPTSSCGLWVFVWRLCPFPVFAHLLLWMVWKHSSIPPLGLPYRENEYCWDNRRGIRSSPRKHGAASGIYPLTVSLWQGVGRNRVNKSCCFFFLELFINPNRKLKYVTVLLEVKNKPPQLQEQNTLRCIPLSSLMNTKEWSLAWLTQSI